jgi:hypothetical protein
VIGKKGAGAFDRSGCRNGLVAGQFPVRRQNECAIIRAQPALSLSRGQVFTACSTGCRGQYPARHEGLGGAAGHPEKIKAICLIELQKPYNEILSIPQSLGAPGIGPPATAV